MSADYFDPFNHQKVQYSMCPVLLKCMNFNLLSSDKIGRMLPSSIVPVSRRSLRSTSYVERIDGEQKEKTFSRTFSLTLTQRSHTSICTRHHQGTALCNLCHHCPITPDDQEYLLSGHEISVPTETLLIETPMCSTSVW
ncbi:uncharacterized protein [Asterias amurensis]|uniref:uncharacterized protein n=1 Tax=Asterias amurensis TaxID=7602 RepID=UPI003AB81EB6